MANDYVDPPEEVPEGERVKVLYPDAPNGHKEGAHFPIRKARVADVEPLLELVNGFAAQNLMLPRGPQYIFENIRDFAVVVDEKTKRSSPAAACTCSGGTWPRSAPWPSTPTTRSAAWASAWWTS